MNYLKLQCDGELLAVAEAAQLFSGDQNTVAAVFTFSEEWATLAKTAIFTKDKKVVYSVLLDDDGVAAVPNEVLRDKGAFFVGVAGAAGEQLLTSSVVKIKVGEGAITSDTRPADPTPDIYAQILAEYKNAVDVAVTEHAAKLEEAGAAAADCYAAISALALEMLDYNGGGPLTDEESEDDVNGGSPSTI